MANCIIYVRKEVIHDVIDWLEYPDFTPPAVFSSSIKFYPPADEYKHEYVAVVVDYDSFIMLSDYVSEYTEHKFALEPSNKTNIDSNYILKEYLERIGANASSVYTQDAQTLDEIIHLCSKIIEERYTLIENN